MSDRLTHTQLQQLVAEVERFQNRQQDELDMAQVREILQELHLSPDLLPDAMVQLQRREALAIQHRRRRWGLGGAILVVVLLVGGGLWFNQQQQYRLNRVSAQSDYVRLAPSPDLLSAPVGRPATLVYEITLKDAPVGTTLPLRCDWLDANGQIVHQNRYATKSITSPIWPTYCRYTLKPTDAPGAWRVILFQGDRQLSDATFEVR